MPVFSIDYELICVTDEGAVFRVMWGDGKSRMVLIKNEDMEEDEPP